MMERFRFSSDDPFADVQRKLADHEDSISKLLNRGGQYISDTPPNTAVDGTEWVYPKGNGYWKFVYDSDEPTYKWKFIGGKTATHAVHNGDYYTGEYAGWGAGVHNLTTYGPVVECNRMGVYTVLATCQIYAAPADNAAIMVTAASSATEVGLREQWVGHSYTGYLLFTQAIIYEDFELNIAGANRGFIIKYETLGGSPAAYWGWRYLGVTPVKVA